MRKILVRSAIILVCFGFLALAWIIAGRQVTLWLDGFGTAEVRTLPITLLGYDGAETGKIFRVGDITLSTAPPDNRPFPVNMRADEQGGFVMKKGEKSLPLGKTHGVSESNSHEFAPDSGDEVFLTIRRSFLSWPTPFDFNFMTGHSPSWKRHRYYRLTWTKKSGPKLIMLWRYEQYFYSGDGWAGGFMTHEGSTGLVRVDIEE